MTNLLIALACCCDDAPSAERLLDHIYQLNGKVQHGHVLLAYAHDVHQEMRLKLRLCAELAFESVSEFHATSRMLATPEQKPIELTTKVQFTNNLWNQTAHHVAGHYRWPWLWLEPDCVPIVPNWIELISEAYQKQPKKFMGRKMKRGPGENEQPFLARVAVYPVSAYAELRGFQGSPPFEWVSGPHVVPRSSTCKLFQETRYDGNIASLDLTAALLHSDKTGRLIEQLRERNGQATEHQNGESIEVKVSPAGPFISSIGSGSICPVELVREPTLPIIPILHQRVDPDDIEPADKRTKLYKDWAKRNAKKVKA